MMSSNAGDFRRKVVPAQPGLLAIYNPSLGQTDETLKEQIVYYYSLAERRSKRRKAEPTEQDAAEQENERLRHIGVAQAMAEFGRTFSGGQPVDTIKSEKATAVLLELEAGWWILASIDLTRIRRGKRSTDGKKKTEDADASSEYTYSSKWVKPPDALLHDLRQAHAAFLADQAPSSSMSALYEQSGKQEFTSKLAGYWDDFLSTWNVMVQATDGDGNSGVKMGESGELRRASGEEREDGRGGGSTGLVGRMGGLFGSVVSRLGGQGQA